MLGVKSIAHKTKLTRIDITARPAFIANGFMHAIEKIFERLQTRMEIVSRSEIQISLACEESAALPSILLDLREIGAVQSKQDQAIISCVGEGIHNTRPDGSTVLKILNHIDPTILWQSTSDINLIAVVDKDNARSVLTRLHQEIFECDWAHQERAAVEIGAR
jgi:aspartokinase